MGLNEMNLTHLEHDVRLINVGKSYHFFAGDDPRWVSLVFPVSNIFSHFRSDHTQLQVANVLGMMVLVPTWGTLGHFILGNTFRLDYTVPLCLNWCNQRSTRITWGV